MEDLEGLRKELAKIMLKHGVMLWGEVWDEFTPALTKLVEDDRKDTIELLKEAVEGWDNNFESARSEFEVPNEEKVWDKKQDRINFIKDYLTKLTDSKVGKEKA